MIKLVAIGLWASLLSVGTSYFVNDVSWERPRTKNHASRTIVIEKTQEMNIPIIRNGKIGGYVVAVFGFKADPKLAEEKLIRMEVVDAAYKLIYTNKKIDFSNIQKIDLDKLTKDIEQVVNKKMKGSVVSNISIQEMTLVTSGETSSPI